MNREPVFLYVEDDTISREVMEMTLIYRMGYSRCTIFENSADFDTKLAALAQPPDIIFLDIHMEPLNGFEMLKIIRAQGNFSTSKVIALTASVMNEEVAALELAGFDGTIAKPIDPDLFPGLVKRILQGERVWHIA